MQLRWPTWLTRPDSTNSCTFKLQTWSRELGDDDDDDYGGGDDDDDPDDDDDGDDDGDDDHGVWMASYFDVRAFLILFQGGKVEPGLVWSLDLLAVSERGTFSRSSHLFGGITSFQAHMLPSPKRHGHGKAMLWNLPMMDVSR